MRTRKMYASYYCDNAINNTVNSNMYSLLLFLSVWTFCKGYHLQNNNILIQSWDAPMKNILRKSFLKMSSPLIYSDIDSERLKKAKLRLAEAQGVIQIGGSDSYFEAYRFIKWFSSLLLDSILFSLAQSKGANNTVASAQALQVLALNFELDSGSKLNSLQKLVIPGFSQAKVREISWRVAEPLLKYGKGL